MLSAPIHTPRYHHLNLASSPDGTLDEELLNMDLEIPDVEPQDSVTLSRPNETEPPPKDGPSKLEIGLGVAVATGGILALVAALPGNQGPEPSSPPPAADSVVIEVSAQSATTGFESSMLGFEMEQAEQRYGLPDGYLKALAWERTQWNPNFEGQAFGIMALNPNDSQHAEFFEQGDWQDPAQSIEFAARKIHENYQALGDWDTSFALFAGQSEGYATLLKAYTEVTPWNH